MTLTQIRYFLAVCKCGTISKAAQDQHISQPAISAAIKELEAEFNGPLFQRNNNGLILTKVGELFRSQAEEFISHYERMCGTVQRALTVENEFSLGVTPMVGCTIIPTIIQKFYDENPGVKVNIREGGNNALLQMVQDGSLDMALVTKRVSQPDIESLWVKEWRLKFCVSVNHPLAKRERVTIEDIGDMPLVMLPVGYSHSIAVKEAFAKYEMEPNVIYRTEQISAVSQFIIGGITGGFLEDDLVEHIPEIASFAIEELPASGKYLIWKKGHYMPDSAKEFRQCIKRIRDNL